MKIIGIAGTNGSGKDTVATVLEENYGYFVASASKILEDELLKQGLPPERTNKGNLSAKWRREFGLDVIVNKAIDQAKSVGAQKLVVGSIRNPGESEKIHKLGGIIIWVDADPEIRYQRIQANDRGRIEDRKSFEEFMREEEMEMNHSGDEATLSSAEVKKTCDVFVENNGGKNELENQIKEKLSDNLQH
jgi:dephospho-CoA kinase